MDVFAHGGYRPVEEEVVHSENAILINHRYDDEFLAVALEHGEAEELCAGLRAVLNSYATLGRGPAALAQAGIHHAVFFHHVRRQPAAGDETRLAVVGQYPHRGGA